jgi:hypothetical protein
MAAIAEREALARRGELGLRALVRDCVTSTRIERVQHNESIEGRHELVVQWPDAVRCLEQNPIYLSLLFDLELADAVPFLHRGGRLHEQRRPGA